MIVNPRTQLFETPNGGLSIHDVVDNNAEHLEALLDLYRELFPEYLSALPRVREKAFSPVNADPRFVRHQWIVLLNEAPIGLVSFKFSVTRSLGLCFSIAVRPAYRSLAWDGYRRMSDFLIQQMVRQLEVDAAHSGCPMPLGLVVEVEMAASTTEPALQKTRDHLLKRYQEYGFVHLPVKYHEPASVRSAPQDQFPSDLQKNAQPMHLCMLPLREKDGLNPPNRDALELVIDTLLMDHYGLSEDHWIVQQARESI